MEKTYTKETVFIAQCLIWANNRYQVEIFLKGLSCNCENYVFKKSVKDALFFANKKQKEWLCSVYAFLMNESLF